MQTGKHAKFFVRGLGILPEAYQDYDASLPSLVFFCFGGLSLMGKQDLIDQHKQEAVAWVYSLQHHTGQGFRGSPSLKIGAYSKATDTVQKDEYSPYDPPNLASTFFCLCILALVGDESMRVRIDRERILRYVGKCQRANGSFAPQYHEDFGPFGDHDPRYTYLACSIIKALGGVPSNYIDVQKATEFIQSLYVYDGGLGDRPGSESHAGLIYCGVAGLAHLGVLDDVNWNGVCKYLSARQIGQTDIKSSHWEPYELGGFNGRPNKPADTCYSFWTCGSLAILQHLDFVDAACARRFLIDECQDSLLGGFVKAKGSRADPLHSYLGLAALSLLDPDSTLGLKQLDPALCLPVDAAAFLSGVWRA